MSRGAERAAIGLVSARAATEPQPVAAMFTVCPKCALTLVVTAADLRVAQGYVRCGRCSSVFNALARLTDERQAAALEPPQTPADEPAEPPANPRQSATPAPENDDDLTDDALEFDPSRTDA